MCIIFKIKFCKIFTIKYVITFSQCYIYHKSVFDSHLYPITYDLIILFLVLNKLDYDYFLYIISTTIMLINLCINQVTFQFSISFFFFLKVFIEFLEVRKSI